VDGSRGSAAHVFRKIHNYRKPELGLLGKMKRLFCCSASQAQSDLSKIISSDGSYPHEQLLYMKTIKNFLMMKIRMKISYEALLNGRTIHEHILCTILMTFK
jgi:hypothetical protein